MPEHAPNLRCAGSSRTPTRALYRSRGLCLSCRTEPDVTAHSKGRSCVGRLLQPRSVAIGPVTWARFRQPGVHDLPGHRPRRPDRDPCFDVTRCEPARLPDIQMFREVF